MFNVIYCSIFCRPEAGLIWAAMPIKCQKLAGSGSETNRLSGPIRVHSEAGLLPLGLVALAVALAVVVLRAKLKPKPKQSQLTEPNQTNSLPTWPPRTERSRSPWPN